MREHMNNNEINLCDGSSLNDDMLNELINNADESDPLNHTDYAIDSKSHYMKLIAYTQKNIR